MSSLSVDEITRAAAKVWQETKMFEDDFIQEAASFWKAYNAFCRENPGSDLPNIGEEPKTVDDIRQLWNKYPQLREYQISLRGRR